MNASTMREFMITKHPSKEAAGHVHIMSTRESPGRRSDYISPLFEADGSKYASPTKHKNASHSIQPSMTPRVHCQILTKSDTVGAWTVKQSDKKNTHSNQKCQFPFWRRTVPQFSSQAIELNPSIPSAPQKSAAFRGACTLACALHRPVLRIDLINTAINARASS